MSTVKIDRQLDRWTSWAQSVSARHERFMIRRGYLVMTLLEPLRMSVAINQRRENFALSLFPRIQVSVGTILQQIAPAQFRSFVQNSSLVAGGDRHEWRLLKQSVQSNNALNLSHSTTTLNLKELNAIVEAHQEVKKFSQSPVARLFARVQREHHGVVMLQKLLIEHDRRTIAERVEREHSRVEQRRHTDIVIRQQNLPSTPAEEQQNVTLEKQVVTARTHTHSWPDKPPEINVDQLTEQVIRKIDHRITAYRERLGRAF